MSDGAKQMSKADYRKEANQKFGVSARSFDKEWRDCIARTGSDWDRAGRPRKITHRKSKHCFRSDAFYLGVGLVIFVLTASEGARSRKLNRSEKWCF